MNHVRLIGQAGRSLRIKHRSYKLLIYNGIVDMIRFIPRGD